MATNALGTLHLVKASERLNVETFIYLQTALGYGRPDSTPIPITHPLRPQSSYGISKVAGELYALGAKLPQVFSFRLANVCAPRLSIGPFPTFFKRILSNEACTVSEAVRDFLDIEDFLSLLELAFRSKAACKRAFNVSTGVGYSIEQLYRAVESVLEADVGEPTVIPVGDDDIKSVVLDAGETQDYFGWSPRKSFDEIVKRQIEWFKAMGVGHIRSHLKSLASRGQ
jgi:nucleoside-diphosphate-sugar epimerase